MKNDRCKYVSVIVSIYKVEDSLNRCLDSLYRQSMRNIEIILVDDASPDRCGEICEEYAAKDDRFRVIHHANNKGLSAARNTGIANATCNFLMFVDGDDYVHKDFCRLPYEYAIRYQADLVMFRFQRVNQNGSIINNKSVRVKPEVAALLECGYKTQIEALELLQCDKVAVRHAVWNKLYHRNIFKRISFPVDYLFEDAGTTYKAVLIAKKIYFLDSFLYYYCFREGSITTYKTKKALLDWVTMHIQQYQDLLSWGRYPSEKLDSFLLNFAMEYCIRKKRDLSEPQYVFCENALRSYNSVPKSFSMKRKVLFMLLKYSPAVFELICSLCKKKNAE